MNGPQFVVKYFIVICAFISSTDTTTEEKNLEPAKRFRASTKFSHLTLSLCR